MVVLGASTYSVALAADSGGAPIIDGAYLERNTSLPGRRRGLPPGANLFLKWVQTASPGFKPDLYTLYGWISGELFVQALRAAGRNPTRGSVLQALRSVKSFSADGCRWPGRACARSPGV